MGNYEAYIINHCLEYIESVETHPPSPSLSSSSLSFSPWAQYSQKGNQTHNYGIIVTLLNGENTTEIYILRHISLV